MWFVNGIPWPRHWEGIIAVSGGKGLASERIQDL